MTDLDMRVLPRPSGARTTIPSWVAHLACGADLRTNDEKYAAVAARLIIVDGELHEVTL